MVICINFYIKFENIHVIYLFTCRLLSSKSMTNIILITIMSHKNKSDDKATPNKYVIVNKWVEPI